MADYQQDTQGIKVSVRPVYQVSESFPAEGMYCWTYYIHIENQSEESVKLLSRYWHITDGYGHVKEVRGEGVVGETPTLEVGEQHDYNSYVYLNTDNGIMAGYYEMEVQEGHRKGRMIKITVPTFSLDSDHRMSMPN